MKARSSGCRVCRQGSNLIVRMLIVIAYRILKKGGRDSREGWGSEFVQVMARVQESKVCRQHNYIEYLCYILFKIDFCLRTK